jgi:beta-lactamase class A
MRALRAALVGLGLAMPLLPAATAEAAPAAVSSFLQQRVSAFRGGAGVIVSDPVSGDILYANRPDQLVVTASLYKLAVLIEAERRVELGTLRYSTPVHILPQDITADGSFVEPGRVLRLDDALELMTTYSDNGSALALLRMLGPSNINATLSRAGIRPFHVALGPWEDMSASPRAIGALFTALAKRSLISTAASDRMLARLARQQVNDRLPAELPPGTVVAHKTGNLGFVTHDAGIIYGPRNAPLVVVAMTWGSLERVAVDLIADLGRLVFEHGFYRPPKVGLSVPESISGDVGRSVLTTVRVTNASDRAWTLSDADRLGLVWNVRDAHGTSLTHSGAPLSLGALGAGESIDLPVVIDVPLRDGDHTVTFEVATARLGPISDLGTPSGVVALHARPIASATIDAGAISEGGVATPPVAAAERPAAASLAPAFAPAVAAVAALPLVGLVALGARFALWRRRPLRLLSYGTRAAVSVLALVASALAERWP